MTEFLLFLSALLAGFITAIAGGGGLILLPLGLFILKEQATLEVLGTMKVAVLPGVIVTLLTYRKSNYAYSERLHWFHLVLCFFLSLFGASLVGFFSEQSLTLIVIFSMLFFFVLALVKKEMGLKTLEAPTDRQNLLFNVLFVLSCLYQGMIGVGSGVLMIFILTLFKRLSFIEASATMKYYAVISLSTSMAYFLYQGWVYWPGVWPLLIGGIISMYIGTKTAVMKGNHFVRNVVLVMQFVLIVKMSYDWINEFL